MPTRKQQRFDSRVGSEGKQLTLQINIPCADLPASLTGSNIPVEAKRVECGGGTQPCTRLEVPQLPPPTGRPLSLPPSLPGFVAQIARTFAPRHELRGMRWRSGRSERDGRRAAKELVDDHQHPRDQVQGQLDAHVRAPYGYCSEGSGWCFSSSPLAAGEGRGQTFSPAPLV